MKLLLFSDLHLDRPFRWATVKQARTRRQNLRATLRAIAEVARQHDVDAVCCGGDLYEHEGFAADTPGFLVGTFADLAPTPVLLAPGNHDACVPTSIYRQASWSPNVTVFYEPRFASYKLADGFTVWGAGHDQPTIIRNLLEGVRVDRGGINLALFHGSENGEFAWQGSDKVAHAPFPAAQIRQVGFDFALLGHYHRPSVTDSFVYPGNPDPLDFGEDGQRGAVLVSVDDDGSVSCQTVPVAVSNVAALELDLSGVSHLDEAQQRARDLLADHEGMVRLTLVGEVPPEVDVIPEHFAQDVVAPHLEALVVRVGQVTVTYDLDTLAESPTVVGQFVRAVRASELDVYEKRRVLITGLRAIDGRDDLAVEV